METCEFCRSSAYTAYEKNEATDMSCEDKVKNVRNVAIGHWLPTRINLFC